MRAISSIASASIIGAAIAANGPSDPTDLPPQPQYFASPIENSEQQPLIVDHEPTKVGLRRTPDTMTEVIRMAESTARMTTKTNVGDRWTATDGRQLVALRDGTFALARSDEAKQAIAEANQGQPAAEPEPETCPDCQKPQQQVWTLNNGSVGAVTRYRARTVTRSRAAVAQPARTAIVHYAPAAAVQATIATAEPVQPEMGSFPVPASGGSTGSYRAATRSNWGTGLRARMRPGLLERRREVRRSRAVGATGGVLASCGT